jgi:hypothetical protein
MSEQENQDQSTVKAKTSWKEDAIKNGETDKNIELVATNNDLERELHAERIKGTKRLSAILAISVIANFILGYAIFGYFPLTRFVAVKDAHAVCDVSPVNEPLVDNVAAGQFAVDSMISVYTFDHLNFQRQITESTAKYFTPEFKQQFLNIFSGSAMLESVRAQYASVASTVDDRVQIMKYGVNGKGLFSWEIQVPLLLTVKSGPIGAPQRLVAVVTVVRQVPTRNNPTGLGIDNVVIRQRLI